MLEFFKTFYIDLAFGLSFPLTGAIQSLCIPFLLVGFERSRRYALRVLVSVPCVWLALVLLSSLWYMIFGMSGMAYHVYVVYPVLLAAYSVVASDRRPLVRVINSCIGACTFAVHVRLGEAIGIVIRNATGSDLYGVSLGLLAFMALADIVIVNVFSLNDEKKVRGVSAATIAAVSVLSIGVQMFNIPSAEYGGFIIFVNFSLWAIVLFSYYMIYLIIHSQNVNTALLVEKRAAENDLRLMRVSEENVRRIREIRHDIKNLLSALRVLLEEKKYDEALRLFGSMERDLMGSGALALTDCGNAIVSAVVNAEMRKAADAGVTIDARIAVPRELPFPENDICSLLSNLLDNAVEATAACAAEARKPVELEIKSVGTALLVRVRNVYDDSRTESEVLSLRTTKDAEMHGYGTKIVGKIANRYCGAVKYDASCGRFTADVMLQVPTGGG